MKLRLFGACIALCGAAMFGCGDDDVVIEATLSGLRAESAFDALSGEPVPLLPSAEAGVALALAATDGAMIVLRGFGPAA